LTDTTPEASTARRFRKRLMLLAGVLAATFAAFLLVACGGGGDEEATPTAQRTAVAQPTTAPAAASPEAAGPCPPAGAATTLTGAGATFPFPLYSKWIDEFGKQCNVQINYQSIGSGGGIKQITAKTVDFGASDGIMNDEQTAAAEAAGGPILHIPMTAGAVAVVFNLPNIERGQLKLTPDVLADIYLKNISKWNDPRIAASNPDVNLPDTDIAVVHRSDGSGTSFIFTNYLSKVSQEWADSVGFATSVEWPGDIGGEGNEGVANQVRQIPGAIGYVELAYAVQNDLPWAAVQNKSGNFEEPSLDGATAAATGVSLPDDMKVLLTDSSNPNAYPIVGFTWILAYVNQTDEAKGQALVYYLWWSIHDGQQFTKDLDYASLSTDAVKKAEAEIKSISFQGQPLLQVP
jgi:phosphate transport system substrate-binding protein